MHWLTGRVRRLRASSIWGPGNVSSDDARMRRMLRRALPEFYVATFLFGVLGVLGGVPALRQTFGEDYASLIGCVLAILAVVAGAGQAFPVRLWRVEFYAVSLLSVVVLLYAAAVLWAAFQELDLGRGAVAFAIYAMSVLPRWRITDIYRERTVHGWS
jgi:hypothetical protein